MPTQERSLPLNGPDLGGNQSYNQRSHREAMARNTSSQGSNPRADVQPSQWGDADWDQDHDEAACHDARRLLSGSNSAFHPLCRHFRAPRRLPPPGTAPKAEVNLSGTALLMGQLRAESLNLVDAELAVRITPDGYVTVSTGDTERPLATGVTSKRQAGGMPQAAAAMPPPPVAPPSPGAPQSGTTATAPAPRDATTGGLDALAWLGSLTPSGQDGQNSHENGL